jgi:hypothetical protein
VSKITWPASVLLVALVLCTTFLTYKAIIPSHVFFTIAGLVVGYLLPKSQDP